MRAFKNKFFPLNKNWYPFYLKIKNKCYVDFVSEDSHKISTDWSNIKFIFNKFFYLAMLAPFYSGQFLGFLLYNLLSNKIEFLRLNLDHFGPIINVFAFYRSPRYTAKKTYIILANGFPNPELLKLFPKNFIFLDGLFFSIFLRGLFFSRLASSLVGALSLDERLTQPTFDFSTFSVKNECLAPLDLTESVLNDSEVNSLRQKIGEGGFVALYCRTPGWKQSAQRSARNQSPDTFKLLIKNLVEAGIVVVRFGGHYQPIISFSNKKFIDTTSYIDSSHRDIWIWKNCSCIIGSVSGATHVPSIIFRKPTLYFGSHSLGHHALLHGLRHHVGQIPDWITWVQASDTNKREVIEYLSNPDKWPGLVPCQRALLPAEILSAASWFMRKNQNIINLPIPSKQRITGVIFSLFSHGKPYAAVCKTFIDRKSNNIIIYNQKEKNI